VDRRIERLASPRWASVLLVTGALRADDRDDLRRLHDQLPHPRATLWWRTARDPVLEVGAEIDGDPAAMAAAHHRDLVRGRRESEADLLPDEPPNPWRGVGPFGQGGQGMMGGTPYGRPMPMVGDERRDGLMLSTYTARFGPFLATLPPGLQLELTLQGDVVQHAVVRRPPSAQTDHGPTAALRRIARLLDLVGLHGRARRLRLAARRGSPPRRPHARIASAVIPRGLGAVDGLGDIRARLDAWCRAAGGEEPAPQPLPEVRLVDLLPGLEWSQAMLVANSFDAATLARICPVDGGENDA
jgi:hypothetical protein